MTPQVINSFIQWKVDVYQYIHNEACVALVAVRELGS